MYIRGEGAEREESMGVHHVPSRHHPHHPHAHPILQLVQKEVPLNLLDQNVGLLINFPNHQGMSEHRAGASLHPGQLYNPI